MLRNRNEKCGRCAFGTAVSETKIFCSFGTCPYEKHPDPFGEKQAAMKHKMMLEEEKKKLEEKQESNPEDKKVKTVRKKKA